MITCHPGASSQSLQAPKLVRELKNAGHEVKIELDQKARLFVGPSAFVSDTEYENNESYLHNTQNVSGSAGHRVYYAVTADVVASLARGMEPGRSGGLTFVFPAMDAATAAHPAVRENIELLRADGTVVLEGVYGEAVSAEEAAAVVFGRLGREGGSLSGVKLLVTAGGTHENIDSVRFIGNRSSGKMGLAVAREAHRMGAEVTVIAANIPDREPGVSWVPVESVGDMQREVMERVGGTDAIVMESAVSDFTPASRIEGKIRRGDSRTMTLELEATADILGGLRGDSRKEAGNRRLFVVGFAATHGDPISDAREKLAKKRADIIVGNDISQAGIGFSSNDNEVHIVGKDVERFVPRDTKSAVARVILEVMSEEMAKMRQGRSD